MTTRRAFLLRAGACVGGILAAPLGVACAGLPVVEPADPEAERVVLGLHPSGDLDDAEDAIHRTLEHVDLGWLSRGDSVFVKVACNSGGAHPAVTSPVAVRAVCRALRDRGAGRVLVGDQSGVMSVRLAAGDRRFRSTRALMEGNGLLAAIEDGGGEPFFFDEQGYDDGYVRCSLPSVASAWREPPFVARVATEVDHLVYLPRLSSHVLTGNTHGLKLVVGFLRDDSRHAMHHGAGTIYEKYAEASFASELRDRLRLVVTYNDEILVDGGPDGGGIATADPRIVIASSHLANHDAVAGQVLAWAQRHLPVARTTGGVPHGPLASAANLVLLAAVEATTGIPWTSRGAGVPGAYLAHDWSRGMEADRALARAYAILGGVPRAIRLDLVGAEPPESLRERLAAHAPLAT